MLLSGSTNCRKTNLLLRLSPSRLQRAYANTKNWSRLKRWTRSGSWGDSDYLAHCLSGNCRRRQSRNGDATAYRIRNTCGARPNKQQTSSRSANLISRVSLRNGTLTKNPNSLWLRVAKNPPMRREALDALRRLYRAKMTISKTLRHSPTAARKLSDRGADHSRPRATRPQQSSKIQRVSRSGQRGLRSRAKRSSAAPSLTRFPFIALAGTPRALRSYKNCPQTSYTIRTRPFMWRCYSAEADQVDGAK